MTSAPAWNLSPQDVTTSLGTDPAQGLSEAEAARRLAANGPNELPGKPPTPAWRRLLAHLNDPLVHLLLVAVVISTLAWVLAEPHFPTKPHSTAILSSSYV